MGPVGRPKSIQHKQIGQGGQLQEWQEDWDLEAPEQKHRHISHLYALFPSAQITPRGTPELAAAVRRSLELRFKAALGSTVYGEVQRQQLERAEVLLVENPKLTIAEVAYACGFQDARHLNVVCRRKLGKTPGALRRMQ